VQAKMLAFAGGAVSGSVEPQQTRFLIAPHVNGVCARSSPTPVF
jgi:hypothetical protein